MKSKLTLRMTGLLMALTPLISFTQILDVEGGARISTMVKDNSADSVVVRLPDGTLAVRDASTLTQFQVLSISNDTVYLTDGGFIILPDPDSTNELQSLSEVLAQDSSAANQRIKNLKNPVDAQDAVTKNYVDPESESALSYNTNWGDYGITYNDARFYKQGGRVYLDGLVRKSNIAIIGFGEVIGTLPVNYRPAKRVVGAGYIEEGYVRIDIMTNGQITLVNDSSSNADWVSLLGISFRLN